MDTLYSAEQYGDSVRALEVLIWTLPFMYASELLGYVVLITNREKLVARAVVVSTTLNVVLNLLLVPRYGLIAASLMTVMTEAVLVAQHLWNLRPLTQAIDWVQAFVRPLLATVVMGVAINLVGAWLPWWSLIGVGAVVYAIAGYALGVFRLDDLRVFQRNHGKVAEA